MNYRTWLERKFTFVIVSLLRRSAREQKTPVSVANRPLPNVLCDGKLLLDLVIYNNFAKLSRSKLCKILFDAGCSNFSTDHVIFQEIVRRANSPANTKKRSSKKANVHCADIATPAKIQMLAIEGEFNGM